MLNPIPFFTIVIPTLNEEKYLPQLLMDLQAQSYTDFQVIVVDGGSIDRTTTTVASFRKQLRLSLIKACKRGVSYQRNLGGHSSKSPWILFMDADDRLPNYFLDGLRYQIARNKDIDLFTTLISVSESTANVAIQHFINLSLEIAVKFGKPQAFGAMIGCRREMFAQIDFDEQTKYLEDSSFVALAIAKKYKYQLFHQPRYTYSLRRIKKEGGLIILRNVAATQIEFLQGKRRFNDDRYPMLGGRYYEGISNDSIANSFRSLQNLIKSASDKQLDYLRKALQKIWTELD